MANKIRDNFWLDTIIFIFFTVTAITGLLLWQVVPGGRGNQDLAFLALTHHDWNQIHVWVALGMLVGSAAHVILHWQWVSCVAGRIFGKVARLARLNFWLDMVIFIAFLIANVSGLLLWLILPSGGFQGGRNSFYNMAVLALNRHDWRDLHLTAGVIVMVVLAVHLALHWNWIVCAIRRYTKAALCRAKECAA